MSSNSSLQVNEEKCTHPIVVDGLCSYCYDVINIHIHRVKNNHESYIGINETSKPDEAILISQSESRNLAQQELNQTIQDNKLFLIIDLDHTLIHATNNPITLTTHALNTLPLSEILKLDVVSNGEFAISIDSLETDVFVDDKNAIYCEDEEMTDQVKKVIETIENQLIESSINMPPSYMFARMRTFYKVRPGAFVFLRRIAEKFKIVIFTAGDANHAACAMKILDPQRKYITRAYSRSDLNEQGMKSIKKAFQLAHPYCLVVDDTLEIWDEQKQVMPCYPYVYFQMADHFLLRESKCSFDYRSIAERYSYSTYFPLSLAYYLESYYKIKFEDLNINTDQPVAYIIKDLWEEQRIAERFNTPLPFLLADRDLQLQSFYHVLLIAHHVFFTCSHCLLENVSPGVEEIAVPTLDNVLSSLKQFVLTGVVFYIPAGYETIRASSLYSLASQFGAIFTSQYDRSDITHVLLTKRQITSQDQEKYSYPVVNTEWIFFACFLYWRPPDDLGRNVSYRSIFDLVQIQEDINNTSKEYWPEYDGTRFLENSTVDPEICSKDPDLIYEDYSRDKVYDKQNLYNNLRHVIKEVEERRKKTGIYSDSGLKMLCSKLPRKRRHDDPLIQKHMYKINYNNWFKHHNYSIDVIISHIISKEYKLSKKVFNDISKNFEDLIMEGL